DRTPRWYHPSLFVVVLDEDHDSVQSGEALPGTDKCPPRPGPLPPVVVDSKHVDGAAPPEDLETETACCLRTVSENHLVPADRPHRTGVVDDLRRRRQGGPVRGRSGSPIPGRSGRPVGGRFGRRACVTRQQEVTTPFVDSAPPRHDNLPVLLHGNGRQPGTGAES